MSFKNAYNQTMGHEGGYVNDPVDPGGETYKGVSRRNWPDWGGWRIIDAYKPFSDPSHLYHDDQLDKFTRDFYKFHFWDRPNYCGVDKIWEKLAEKLFDTGVNVGTGRASKWLQASLNLLNRNAKYFPDIKVDGGIGPKTLGVLQQALGCNPKDRILTVFAIHQGEHYKDIMVAHPTQERYVGWFDRLTYK